MGIIPTTSKNSIKTPRSSKPRRKTKIMKSDVIDEKVVWSPYGDWTVRVYSDSDAQSPREEPLGKIVMAKRACRHYDVADTEIDEEYSDIYDEFKSYQTEDQAFCLPLYGYETQFGYQFEVLEADAFEDGDRRRKPNGFVAVYPKTTMKWFQLNSIDSAVLFAATLPDVRDTIIGEMETYNEFLRGEVYGYVIESPLNFDDGDEYERSCWGFMGGANFDDGRKMTAVEYCMHEGVHAVEAEVRNRIKSDAEAQRYMAL